MSGIINKNHGKKKSQGFVKETETNLFEIALK